MFFLNFERAAERKLLQGQAATVLASLRFPPGIQLEVRDADRRVQHRICIIDQGRICVVWNSDCAHNVEIVDRRRDFGACPSCLRRFKISTVPRCCS